MNDVTSHVGISGVEGVGAVNTDPTIPRFGKTESGKSWHLIGSNGQTRCDKTPTKNWVLAPDIQYPDTENLCRQCLEPKSLSKEKQLMQVRKAARQSIETMPTISREWRAEAITHLQEMFLLRNGMTKREMLGRTRAWGAENIFRIIGSIHER